MRTLIFAQGLYYAVTGLWPLVSLGTFQKATGPKHDVWLVKAMGAMITAVAASLLASSAAPSAGPGTLVLAIASATALAGVDLAYGARGIISRVYLADAAVEAGLIAGYAWQFAR